MREIIKKNGPIIKERENIEIILTFRSRTPSVLNRLNSVVPELEMRVLSRSGAHEVVLCECFYYSEAESASNAAGKFYRA